MFQNGACRPKLFGRQAPFESGLNSGIRHSLRHRMADVAQKHLPTFHHRNGSACFSLIAVLRKNEIISSSKYSFKLSYSSKRLIKSEPLDEATSVVFPTVHGSTSEGSST